MRYNWTEGRPAVYLDETWVNKHDGKNKAWGEKDIITGGTIGEVNFVILCFLFVIEVMLHKTIWQRRMPYYLHAGGKDGWVSSKKMHYYMILGMYSRTLIIQISIIRILSYPNAIVNYKSLKTT